MLQDIPTPTLREASPCVLETERLLLRRPTLADVKAIARLANDRRIAEMTRRLPHPYQEDDAIAFVRATADDPRDTVFLIESNYVPIGMVGVDWREPEAVDRGRAAQRLEAVQLDAAPLEAAFLQNVARGRVGDAGARDQVLGIEFLEEEIDHRARGFGAKTLAPMRDAEPVAQFRRVRCAAVDAHHAERRMILLDQKHGFAAVGGRRAHEFDRVILQIGVRQAAGIFRNAAIIGEMRNRFYVRERRPAQRQPFGLEDAATRFA